jgi:hypothetical protein
VIDNYYPEMVLDDEGNVIEFKGGSIWLSGKLVIEDGEVVIEGYNGGRYMISESLGDMGTVREPLSKDVIFLAARDLDGNCYAYEVKLKHFCVVYGSYFGLSTIPQYEYCIVCGAKRQPK